MRKEVGRNILRCRERANISQEELAVRASLHRTEIGLLERGERLPRVDTLVKSRAACGSLHVSFLRASRGSRAIREAESSSCRSGSEHRDRS